MDVLYAAGLFEGEGCINIQASKRSRGRVWYALLCVIKMGDLEPIALLRERWGGSIHHYDHAGVLGHRAMYQWQITAREAAAFLREIRPHLLSTRLRTKADLAIAFQAQKRNTGPVPSIAYLDEQVRFYEAMRVLNRRGVSSLSADDRHVVLSAFEAA
jgi:hypothetical protein